MIEKFTKSQFEEALPDELGWKYHSFSGGEHVYAIPVADTRATIMIRSSLKLDGVAAGVGKDSIRVYLVDRETGKPLAKKLGAWIQRTTGWDRRTQEKIEHFYQKGLSMVTCPKCGRGALVQRNGKRGSFYGCSAYPRCKYTVSSLEDIKPKEEEEVVDFAEIFDALDDSSEFDFRDDDYVEEGQVEVAPIRLNDQQNAYVTAPVNADIRVMAAPGSGKTLSTVERIIFLIENGIKPDNIVYVTFTKSMATEGYERIEARSPEVATTNLGKQICTIHALCFRILREEGMRRDVPKEWEIKRELNNIIAGDDRKHIKGEWQNDAEQPGYKEVLYWINLAKEYGYTTETDLDFYAMSMSHTPSERVHNARKRFDEWLKREGYITFADMPYMVERGLITDEAFRRKWQGRYSHVLVDECQDVNQQALRILITLSLVPGDNRVYKGY